MKLLSLVVIVLSLSLIFLTGCEFFFETGVSASDPYDENCNLKDSYHSNWKKYSDFDNRINPTSRSWEAQQYYAQVEAIAQVSSMIHTHERDSAIRDLMIQETRAYKDAIATGHKKNLIKSFIRMTFYTTEVIYDNANAGKGFAKTFLDPTKNGVQLVGEAIKLSESFAPSNSSLALDTETTTGKVQDIAKSGAYDLALNWGEKNAKDVAVDMAKKAEGYIRDGVNSLYPEKPGVKYVPLPEITLSDEDFAILKNEHLKLRELDNLIADAEKKNFESMWAIRELKQEQVYMKNELFDLEYAEKDRVDAKLIADCKRKTGEDDGGFFSFLDLFGGGD